MSYKGPQYAVPPDDTGDTEQVAIKEKKKEELSRLLNDQFKQMEARLLSSKYHPVQIGAFTAEILAFSHKLNTIAALTGIPLVELVNHSIFVLEKKAEYEKAANASGLSDEEQAKLRGEVLAAHL